MNKFSKYLFYYLPAAFCIFFTFLKVDAQEIKKSTKTEIVEEKKYYLHTVEKGQTLFSIAKAYDVSKNDIILENPDLIDGLKDNIVIRIPFFKKTESIKKSSQNAEHKVKSDQTLYAISKKYNTSVEAILNLNPDVKQNGLKTGQVIIVPIAPSQNASPDVKMEIKNTKKVGQQEVSEKKQQNQKIIIPTNSSPTTVKENEKKSSSENQKSTDNKIKESEVIKDVSNTRALYQKPLNPNVPLEVNPGEINVALLVPFFTSFNNLSDSGLTTDLYSRSNIAIEFYQGFKLAADSLAKLGYSIKIVVFDTENDSAILASVLKQPELKQIDLIVGPFYEKEIQQAANEIKKLNVPQVSPFSQSNKPLLSNPFISKCIASQATQSEEIAAYVAKNFKSVNTVLISGDNSKDKALAEIMKRKYNTIKQKGDTLKSLVHNNGSDFKAIDNFIVKEKNNVIIAALNDQAVVTELFNYVKQQKDVSLSIFGCDTWLNFENLDIDALVTNNVHIPTSYYIDYEQNATKQVISAFRNQYLTEPDKYALHGFDVGMFYIKAARNKGLLEKIDKFKVAGVQTFFNFFQTAVDSGWENRNVTILKYGDYKLIKVN